MEIDSRLSNDHLAILKRSVPGNLEWTLLDKDGLFLACAEKKETALAIAARMGMQVSEPS